MVCIGQATHKVLVDEVITKDDDISSQRHEKLGTENIYTYFDNHTDGPIVEKSHSHDRNLSINKLIREKRPSTLNQNDTWHAAKSVEKAINTVRKGSLIAHGKTWHVELSNKIASTKTHRSALPK